MFQVAWIHVVAQGISSVQTLCPANKVCRILTMTEERIGLHEKRILPNTLHGSALRYTTDQKGTHYFQEF